MYIDLSYASLLPLALSSCVQTVRISLLERQVSSLALVILPVHIHRHTFAHRLSYPREEATKQDEVKIHLKKTQRGHIVHTFLLIVFLAVPRVGKKINSFARD